MALSYGDDGVEDNNGNDAVGVKDHGNGGGGDVSSGDNGGDVKDHGEGKAKVRRKECSQG